MHGNTEKESAGLAFAYAFRLIPWTWFNLMKMCLSLAAAAVSMVELVFIAKDENVHRPPADYVAASVAATAFLASVSLLAAQLRRGVRTSGGQFAFYAAGAVCGAFSLRHMVRRDAETLK